MHIRTTETTVTFQRPFKLSAFDRQQPAGTYRLAVDDEEIRGLSFVAYHRVATMLHTPAIATANGRHEVYLVDAAELAAALDSDAP